MTRQVGFWRQLVLFGGMVLWACDGKQPAPGVVQTSDNVCVDLDGDGFGYQCGAGDDCDDDDARVHDDCVSCRKPDTDCACAEDAEPTDCRLPYTLNSAGSVMCHTGTRYCRDGVWSGCEGVVSFVASAPLRTLSSRALVDPDAGPVSCDLCNPDCYRIEDRVDAPVGGDAGVNAGPGVVSVPSGGVTLGTEAVPEIPDAAISPPFAGLLDDAPCAPEDMGDCDGLPPPFDNDPSHAPSGAKHKTIFLDVPTGGSASQTFQAHGALSTLDLYFYLDATYDVGEAINALRDSLRVGNFFKNGGTDVTCVDADFDGAPDESRKNEGIAGNIACLVADAHFGVGWFREIPFYGPLTFSGEYVGPWDMEMFEHRLDLTSDLDALVGSVGGIVPRPNLNAAEANMQGLWALATGGEIYAGWDRPGVPARQGCPAGTFGYPCFRESAIPVVIQIGDAPMESGPNTAARSTGFPPTPANCLSYAFPPPQGDRCSPLHYDEGVLGALESGTEAHYRPLTTTAETIADAQPVGTIDDVLVTYVGDTGSMRADLSLADFGSAPCPVGWAWSAMDETGPDVAFRFRVSRAGRYLISARGTRFDSNLLVAKLNASGNPIGFACADDGVTLGQAGEYPLAMTPELEVTLSPGDYIAVLKGFGAPEAGWFQISFGRKQLQAAGSFAAKRWLGPGDTGSDGVREALQARAIRVIAIQAGDNSFASEQALELAAATGARGPDGPLRGRISGAYNSSLGREIVRVVRELVQTTRMERMDMSLDLLQAPDDPTPDFGLLKEAVASPGCNGIEDTDGDPGHVPDTHLDCVPGARPQFRVTFSNPAGSAAVPSNPADPSGQGGYHMLLRVLGNGSQLIDQLPVYVVPHRVRPDPAPAPYLATGSYEQEIRATACTDGEGPVWGVLSWRAALPAETRLTIEACAADTPEALAACTFHELVTLTPAGLCQSALNCGDDGYCDPIGICHRVVGPSCVTDADCGSAGVCDDSGMAVCTSTRPSLDVKPAAQKDMQGRKLARVRARLWSNPEHTQAPTLLGWTLDYTCAPRE